MNRFITIGCGIASLLAMSFISSCHSEDAPEILKPVSEHILGRWEISAGYIFNDGKWEEHDDPASPKLIYNFQGNDSILICSTDGEGWSSYSMIHYKVDEADMTVTTGSEKSKIELLSADSLVMVSDFYHNPITGETLSEPIHYKWAFRRMDSTQQPLGEMLIGKWKFMGTEEKKNGVWKGPADVPTPTGSAMEFNANGFSVIGIIFSGQQYAAKYNWKINNTNGLVQMKMIDGEGNHDGRVEFDGNDKMWVYYTASSEDGAIRELRDRNSRITLN